MHLPCFFQYSGESYNASSKYFLYSTHPRILFSEQGHPNDLLTRVDGHVPQYPDDRNLINSKMIMRSLVSTPGFSTNLKSDRVHWDPLSRVAYGSRCHTADYLKETKDVDDSVPCPMNSLSKPPPPHGSMCSPSQVQTPLSAHSVRLLLLLMLIVPLYFIAVFAVQETSTVNRIGSYEKLLSPPLRSKCPPQKLTLRLLFLTGGVQCHLQYDLLEKRQKSKTLRKQTGSLTSPLHKSVTYCKKPGSGSVDIHDVII
jgi:hypothetical protein